LLLRHLTDRAAGESRGEQRHHVPHRRHHLNTVLNCDAGRYMCARVR
jgi:hypothetical protein